MIIIVSWNYHFFVIEVVEDAQYIIDKLGEMLYESCKQTYIMKFDKSIVIIGEGRKRKVGVEKIAGTQTVGSNDGEEFICEGKDCCKEYINNFLATILLK